MKVIPRKSPFIRQFDGPGNNGIVCFRFWQAVVASGCPGECAYCFLQTQQPYRRGLYDLQGTLFSNIVDIIPEARTWLAQSTPAGLIVGENQDGLAFEGPYKRLLGVTPLELLIPLFERYNPVGHILVVLSKFTRTEYAEALGPLRNVVFSWSLSLPTISMKYEKKVAPVALRLRKALEMKAAGFRVRLRLDALAPVPGWERELQCIVRQINEIHPEMLTIGALRASNLPALRRAAQVNRRDASILDFLKGRDPSGFKERTDHDFHLASFQIIKSGLASSIRLGLCKEDESMWKDIGLAWQGCHCLHGAADQIVGERIIGSHLKIASKNAGCMPL